MLWEAGESACGLWEALWSALWRGLEIGEAAGGSGGLWLLWEALGWHGRQSASGGEIVHAAASGGQACEARLGEGSGRLLSKARKTTGGTGRIHGGGRRCSLRKRDACGFCGGEGGAIGGGQGILAAGGYLSEGVGLCGKGFVFLRAGELVDGACCFGEGCAGVVDGEGIGLFVCGGGCGFEGRRRESGFLFLGEDVFIFVASGGFGRNGVEANLGERGFDLFLFGSSDAAFSDVFLDALDEGREEVLKALDQLAFLGEVELFFEAVFIFGAMEGGSIVFGGCDVFLFDEEVIVDVFSEAVDLLGGEVVAKAFADILDALEECFVVDGELWIGADHAIKLEEFEVDIECSREVAFFFEGIGFSELFFGEKREKRSIHKEFGFAKDHGGGGAAIDTH